MTRTPTTFDNTLCSRFECKYLVPPRLVESIRRWMDPYVQPDPHARKQPGHRYRISSLYLDTSDLQLFNMTCRGEKNRYKLRVRTYGDDPLDPVFFEVKKRMDGMVYKRRARVERSEALRWILALRQGRPLPTAVEDSRFQEFAQLSTLTRSAPLMRVRYLREAYESKGRDPVRITFDTELSGALSFDGELHHELGPWHEVEPGGVVLEIKFSDRYPAWLARLVEDFGLQRCSVAKYVLTLQQALDDERRQQVVCRHMAAG